MATLINPDGTTEEIVIPSDGDEGIDFLIKILGGYVEGFRIGARMMLVNEKPPANTEPNPAATQIAREWINMPSCGIVGKAVYLTEDETRGQS